MSRGFLVLALLAAASSAPAPGAPAREGQPRGRPLRRRGRPRVRAHDRPEAVGRDGGHRRAHLGRRGRRGRGRGPGAQPGHRVRRHAPGPRRGRRPHPVGAGRRARGGRPRDRRPRPVGHAACASSAAPSRARRCGTCRCRARPRAHASAVRRGARRRCGSRAGEAAIVPLSLAGAGPVTPLVRAAAHRPGAGRARERADDGGAGVPGLPGRARATRRSAPAGGRRPGEAAGAWAGSPSCSPPPRPAGRTDAVAVPLPSTSPTPNACGTAAVRVREDGRRLVDSRLLAGQERLQRPAEGGRPRGRGGERALELHRLRQPRLRRPRDRGPRRLHQRPSRGPTCASSRRSRASPSRSTCRSRPPGRSRWSRPARQCGERINASRGTATSTSPSGGVTQARYVRVEDGELYPCPGGTASEGADLDAVRALGVATAGGAGSFR